MKKSGQIFVFVFFFDKASFKTTGTVHSLFTKLKLRYSKKYYLQRKIQTTVYKKSKCLLCGYLGWSYQSLLFRSLSNLDQVNLDRRKKIFSLTRWQWFLLFSANYYRRYLKATFVWKTAKIETTQTNQKYLDHRLQVRLPNLTIINFYF